MAEGALISLATDSAKGLARLVAARAVDEIHLAWGFKDQLQKLNTKFEQVQAFLEDAGNSKYAQKSKQLKLWVESVKDAAYLADDVMDEYAIEIFRRKMELKNGGQKKFRNWFTQSNPVFVRFRMAHKVKEILSLFDEIGKVANDIGLRQVDVAADTHNYDGHLDDIRKHAAASDSEFVGRKDDQTKLLDVMCSPTDDRHALSIVAVVGMGGLGKTTLARRLYNNERICAHFSNEKIWICVAQNFEITRFLNEMVESVTLSTSKLSNTGAIIRNLEMKLKGKKLLLVLDDVWNDEQDSWDSLKNELHNIGIAPGSVILITTRSDKVADAAGAVFTHKLEGLSNDESWSLFCQKILNSRQPNDYGLEEVGKRIIEKCKGVPLAIKGIRGLLQSKPHLHKWKSIEGSAMFRKGYLGYLKSALIGLWLSQGYLHGDKRKNVTMEETGEKNLKMLLSSSLLEEYVPEGLEIVYNLTGIESCRHLVFDSVEIDPTSVVAPKKLRTLQIKGTLVPWDMVTHSRYLRTLSLDQTGITELPPAVALLKHLRFLDVSYNPISTLPDSIGKLYQLQTLILLGCNNMKKLPKVVNKLVNLRYILTNAPMFAYKGLHQLTKLQILPCLSLNDGGEGWSIDELGVLPELRDEIYIQGLECVKDKDKARKAELAGKHNITKLNLSWMEDRSETSGVIYDEDVLEGLEPHPSITSLKVQNFISVRFPTWVTEMAVLTVAPSGNRTRLNSLTEVKLLNCRKCETLPKLGQLPLLKCLILSGLDVEFIGSEFYGGGDLLISAKPFMSLRELEISGFRKLVTWMEPPEVAFPCLETVRIRECRQLKAVPALGIISLISLELEELDSVETLDIIKYSSGLTSLMMKCLPEITSLPQELANCTKLQVLEIIDLTKLASLPRGLESLVNLQSLKVCWC